MIDLKDFRTDLMNGMSVEDALQKHNLSLKKAVEIGEALQKPSSTPYKLVETHIYQRWKRFFVMKSIKNKTVMFGSYNSLEDAKRVKDYMIKHGWSKYRLDKACKELKINGR